MRSNVDRKKQTLFLAILLVLIALASQSSVALLLQPSSSRIHQQLRESTLLHLYQDENDEITITKRRHVLQKAFILGTGLAVGMSVTSPQPADALKERNEQLCGTGFFTNYLEYKCTDIGDISDEGQRTTFSESEQGAADSLLSKFNLESSSMIDERSTLADDLKKNKSNSNPSDPKMAEDSKGR